MNVQQLPLPSARSNVISVHSAPIASPCDAVNLRKGISAMVEAGRKTYTKRDHVPAASTDPTTGGELSLGTGVSQCGKCGRTFSSVGSFDKHQRLAKDGSVICLDPEGVGLVINKNNRWSGVGGDRWFEEEK